MKIIVGLGNPGKEYDKTRHNAGFDVIDILAEKLNISVTQKKFNALIGDCIFNGEKVILVKPQTFMNLSGNSVVQIQVFYKARKEDIIIIHDDLDLPVGKIRIRSKGSSGGQNGMKDIIKHLNTQEIARIRVGIGHDDKKNTIDYVLKKVSKQELPIYNESLDKAAETAKFFINNPIDLVMNRYNI